MTEVSCQWISIWLILKRDNWICQWHENRCNFHMNQCRFSIYYKKPSKLIDPFNMINHVRSFTLKRVKFFKILSINFKFLLRIKQNRWVFKIYWLFSEKSYALLILLSLTSKSITSIMIIFQTEVNTFWNVFSLCSLWKFFHIR